MKLTNELLKEYLDIKEMVKELEVRMADIKSYLVELNGGETPDFIAVIKDQSRHQIATIREFELKFGRLWLHNNNMIRLVNFKLLDVVKRPVRKP